MKKFKFQLQSLMTIREWDEQNARQELGRVNALITELEGEMEAIELEKLTMNETWLSDSEQRFSAGQRRVLDSGMQEMEVRTRDLTQRMDDARKKRVEALNELEAAGRRKKIVENLKEKRLAEYKAASDKHEANEIEDSIYGRRNNILQS